MVRNKGREVLRYDLMLQRALRGVLREALEEVAERGLPGDHHLYITFRTGAPGVALPDHLQARFPDEMTIVLQHEFWGLEVEREGFEVTLSFSSQHERLVIPFSAVVAFADPSVRFGLQFEPSAADKAQPAEAKADEPATEDAAEETPAVPEPAGEKVVALDRFRRK